MPIIDTTKDLSALFRDQARASPQAVALEDGDNVYTYAELDAEVDALAGRLRGYGVGRNSQVGVLLPRCAHYVIGCLAILRAGGAFLSLELAYPLELLAEVIEDAGPVVVITHASEQSKINKKTPVVCLDSPPTDANGHSKDPGPLPADDDLDRLAFVSYSSGTTGKPKGIANPHRAPVLSYNLRFGVQDVRPGDRVACNVFFIWEIIRPLLRGATVVVVPDEASYDPDALVDLLAAKHVTETLMTPTLLATVLSANPDIKARLPELRTLWLNGEVVTTDLAARAIKTLPQTRLLNCYSACETHEIACGDIRQMFDEKSVYCPVGPPVDPKYIYILDDQGQRVPDGTTGQLFVGGPMLAWGYVNRPETTAEAFVPDPYNPVDGARMYKTGDRARLLESGILEISGRVGTMIKLRGYSVVPGKVQNEILKHLAVSSCCVIAHGDGLDRQLVAYIVPDRDTSEDRELVKIDGSGRSPQARRNLASYLAHYMIPTLWVELDVLPTSEVSGKVDFKLLPPPPTSLGSNGNERHTVSDSINPKDVAALWAATLKLPQYGIQTEDNFFDLGGQSLLLADLSSRLSKAFGFRVPIARLAEIPTLEGHLAAILAARDGHTAAIQADLPSILRKDSTLQEDVRPPKNTICPINTSDTVLLTGVTGFLGAFLLSELLETTDAQIICLVRSNDPELESRPQAISRVRKNLLDLGLWQDSIMERVEILPGNLSQDRFGLSHEEFEDLASRVQVIVHAAATVNLVYPYAALQKANVEGTREIIRLACKRGATLQYVSTNGVLPPSLEKGWSEDTILSVEEVPEKITDGYGQTKWVAEQLVLEAGRRGLPVKIHRAGTISGHSATGASNAWDLVSAIIVESIKLGYAPNVDGWRAEMTPVDFVSKSIIHLSSQTAANQTTFHLGDPDPIDMRLVFDKLEQLGYPTKPLAWNEWVTLWDERRGHTQGGDAAFTADILRGSMPTVDFLRGIIVLDNSATRPFRAAVERPKIDAPLLDTYTRHWFARGWLQQLPRKSATGPAAKVGRRSPLSARVAVITGASSGIGAAVATALVKQGCHVALGARRLDALEAVKSKFGANDGRCIIRKTDVTDRKQVEELVRAASDELGPVDILVSCAGVMYFTMMANVHTEEWEQTVDVNCKGLLHCLSSTVPGMLSRGSGHIVAISSDAGRKVFPGLGVYSASKFFVEATLQSLRVETAGKGLRVTSVQPGNTATDLLNMSSDAEAIKQYGEPSGAQILDPKDVANSIVYALSQPSHVAVNEVLIEPRDEPI
jgi:amino acid adenylation domain-containing protein/thioester reductase-like protein